MKKPAQRAALFRLSSIDSHDAAPSWAPDSQAAEHKPPTAASTTAACCPQEAGCGAQQLLQAVFDGIGAPRHSGEAHLAQLAYIRTAILCTGRTLSPRPLTLSLSHPQASPQQQEQRRQNSYSGVAKTKGGALGHPVSDLQRHTQRPAAAARGTKQHLAFAFQQQTARVQHPLGPKPLLSGLPPTTRPPNPQPDRRALLLSAGALKPFNGKSVFSASRSVKVRAVLLGLFGPRRGAWRRAQIYYLLQQQRDKTPTPQPEALASSTPQPQPSPFLCTACGARTTQPTHACRTHHARRTHCMPLLLLLQFHVRYKCEFGQEVYLVGNCDALGDWDVMRGVQLVWSPGHIWEGAVELPAG